MAVAGRIGMTEARTSFLYMGSLEWARRVTSDGGLPPRARAVDETFSTYQPPEIAAVTAAVIAGP